MDLAILKFINVTLANSAFDIFFRWICSFDIWRWPIGVAVLLLLWKGKATGRWLVLLAILSIAIIDPTIYRIFKPLFGRIRPCHDAALDWVRIVKNCGGLYSFPSAHAANSFALAVVAGNFYKISRYFLFPLAILISLGRVYLGVHFPSDVLAGALLGFTIAWVVIWGASRIAPKTIGKHLETRKSIQKSGENSCRESL